MRVSGVLSKLSHLFAGASIYNKAMRLLGRAKWSVPAGLMAAPLTATVGGFAMESQMHLSIASVD